MIDFEVKVRVKIDPEELPEGVVPVADDIVQMVGRAMQEYSGLMSDEVTACGDAEDAADWVASTCPEVEVKSVEKEVSPEDGPGDYEFTFQCVSRGDTKEEAKADALQYIAEMSQRGELEPVSVVRL